MIKSTAATIKRKPKYFIKREKKYGVIHYWVYVQGTNPMLIEKKPGGWYAASFFHATLRDAIIYCVYGM